MTETKATSVKKELEINFGFKREKGVTKFYFDIPEGLSRIFEDRGLDKVESTKWKGLSFYSLPSSVRDSKYNEQLNTLKLFDDYGQALIMGGRLNIAWIRTVGGKGEITVDEYLSFAEFSSLARNAATFIKNFYEEYDRDFTVAGKITITNV